MNRRKCKACAPTGEGTGKTPPFTQALCRPPVALEGIAAANIQIDGTDVSATTIHAFFDLDAENHTTRLDFAKRTAKVEAILALDVLLLDEAAEPRNRGHALDWHASGAASSTGSGFRASR